MREHKALPGKKRRPDCKAGLGLGVRVPGSWGPTGEHIIPQEDWGEVSLM